MSHYKSNVRDLEFNLFEVLGIDEALGEGAYGDLDADTASEMLGEVARLAEGPLAESFADADRNPPVFDPETHGVTLPESFKKSLQLFTDGGWDKLGIRRGTRRHADAARAVLGSASSCSSAPTRPRSCTRRAPASPRSSTTTAPTSRRSGRSIAAERGWGATMVLTEPDAGSDVGAGRTKAIKQDDGSWHIEGVKRFITSGDSDDLFENIMHLVLARPEGAGPGTKGLSLFFVPKFHFDPETGELGERNGVFVTNVEHKMGLKVSATCELTFGGTASPPRAGWSARSTTASRRCSRSSSTLE